MKYLMTNLTVAFALLSLSTGCGDSGPEINDVADFEIYIQDEVEAQDIPALSVLIFEEDNILYENYLGKTNIQQNLSLESDHLFLLASISKIITSTALLQLQEDGLFSLDDDIDDYLPFEVNHPSHSNAITFRMLLTHTASIDDSGNVLDAHYYYGMDSPIGLDYFIENYLIPGGEYYSELANFHDFEPGTVSEYSNIGSALIGLLVQEISGADFNEYCKQNIFAPLGMMNTSWRLDEVNGTIVQPYNYFNGEYEEIEHYTNTDYPNGGLRSTGRDMFTFLSAFALGGTRNGYELLKTETVDEMVALQIPTIDNTMGLQMYQLDMANNLWGHDGGEQGVSTIMGFNPTTKVGAIILTNHEDAHLDEMLVEAYKLGLEI